MSSSVHAWLDMIPEPAVLVDDHGRPVAWNAASRHAFGTPATVASAVRGLKSDLAATAAAVARGAQPGGHALEGLDAQGRLWRACAERVGPGKAVLRFTGADGAVEDVGAPSAPVDGPVEDDEDEPTAEIVRFERTANALEGMAWREARTRNPGEVVSFQIRSARHALTERSRRMGLPPVEEITTHEVMTVDDEDTEVTGEVTASEVRRVFSRAVAPVPRLPPVLAGAVAPCLLVREGAVLDANDAAAAWLHAVDRERLRDGRLSDLAPARLDSGETAEEALARAEGIARTRGHHTFPWAFHLEAGLGEASVGDPKVVPVEASLTHVDERGTRAWLFTWREAGEPGRVGEADRVRERLSLALARSIRPLLVRDDVDEAVREALATIGSAVRADRCFLVLVEEDRSTGRAINGQRFAWATEGVDQLPPRRDGTAPRGVVPPRWFRVLSSGGVLSGGLDDFPEDEQAILERYEVRSLVVVPVRSEGRLLAFLGLDSCRVERTWTPTEIEILRGMADSFAGAFRRLDAARALRTGRDRYEAAVRGADVAVWELSIPRGELVHADGVGRLLGLRPEDLPRGVDALLGVVHVDDRETCRRVAIAHDAGRLELVDVEVRMRAGNVWKWVLLRGRITERDPSGRPLRANGTMLDIDERKRLLDELRTARELAERASEAKSRFLANMSHEIRTPLNAVLGMAALLQGSRLNATQTDMVDTLRLSGEHLLALLNQILDVSRIESGEFELSRTAFDLRATILEVGDLFRPIADGKGLGLDVRLDERLPMRVVGDALRLRQVLVNLADNALKFTERGGITMMAWCPEPSAPRRVRIEVADTGMGIPQEQLDVLFDAFAQADGSDSRRFGGSGLGLAISRALCDAMGGRLSAESTPGKGSVFRFDLELEGVAEAVPGPKRAALSPNLLPADLKILVVEDNAVNQKVALGMLQRLGCAAQVSDSGHDALELVEIDLPDVVLMDIQMPGMDGIETTRRIRERFGSRTRPWIIAVTAAAQTEDRQRSLASGMNDYITKPVRPAELERALERALEARVT
ncbi:MAG: response regulator [Alphaproteobacteria bacterium]|nr:response regulator [Alphaproteobacteria bacterium]